MGDLLSSILHYVRSLWLRRWYAVAVTWIVCLAGWFVAATVPSEYTSFTRIYVDTDSLLNPLLTGIAVDTDIESRVAVMEQTLLSRPNLEKVARAGDLDLAAKSSSDTVAILADLQANVSISSPSEKLFLISYNGAGPGRAKRVVEALLATFVEGNLGAGREDMGVALRFLDEQTVEYQRQLDATELRLSEFKRTNLSLLSDKNDYFQRAREARAALQQSQVALRETITRRDALQQQLAAEPRLLESAAPTGSGGPPTDEEVRILELEKTLDTLLSRYTEKHPDVISVKRRLEELRQALNQPVPKDAKTAASVESINDDDNSSSSSNSNNDSLDVISEPNPVYDQLKLQLVQEEANIATLSSRIAEQAAISTELESALQSVPQMEQEHTRLTREVDTLRKHLEDLLARRESARMSQQREKVETVRFRIIDPPNLPTAPSGPNRPLFFILALIAGIGAGAAFGLALVAVTDAFSDVRRLKQAFGVPVLGSVSLVRSAAAGWGRLLNNLAFVSICVILIVALAGLIMLDQKQDLASLSLPRLSIPLGS